MMGAEQDETRVSEGPLLDFGTEESFDHLKHNLGLKIHSYVGLGLTLICFIIWTILSFFGEPVFPFFIFPWAIVAMSVSIHYYTFIHQPARGLTLHAALIIIISVLMFLTNLLTSAYHYCFIVTFALAIPFAVHYTYVKYKTAEHRFFYVHTAFWMSVNMLVFIIWLMTPSPSPWFAFSLFGTSLFVVVHWSLVFHRGNLFILHASVFCDIQLLLLFIWIGGFTAGVGFPWFIFPFFGWGVLLAIHDRFRNKSNPAHPTHQPQDLDPRSPSTMENAPLSNVPRPMNSTATPISPLSAPTYDMENSSTQPSSIPPYTGLYFQQPPQVDPRQ